MEPNSVSAWGSSTKASTRIWGSSMGTTPTKLDTFSYSSVVPSRGPWSSFSLVPDLPPM